MSGDTSADATEQQDSVWVVRVGEIGDVLDVKSVRKSAGSAAACARRFVPKDVNKMINHGDDGSLTITWDGHSKIATTTEAEYEW